MKGCGYGSEATEKSLLLFVHQTIEPKVEKQEDIGVESSLAALSICDYL